MQSHTHNFSISTKTSTDTKWQYRISSSKISRSQIAQRNIDKETLVQENYQLKMQINKLQEELTATRVKYHHLEKEQYSGAIDDKSTLVQKLKKSLKIAENSLLQKLREIDEFKKTSRFTKLQELEIELENYQQETIRLKKLNDQQQRFMQQNNQQSDMNDYEFQEQTIKKLCQENLELMSQEAQLKSQNQQLKFQIEKLEIDIAVKTKENAKLLKQKQNQPNQENQIQTKTRQQIYRESVERAQLLSRIDQVDKDYGKQLKEKDDEISRLVFIITQKNQQIEDYEKASITVTEKNVSQYEQLTLDNQVSDALKKRESKINTQSFHKLSIITSSSNQMIKKKSIFIDQNHITKTKSIDEFDEIAEFQYANELILQLKPNKKFHRINFYEIQPIGQQLKLELQIKMVPIEECEQIFDGYEELSITDLISIFSVEPFKMINHDERKLLSRYLIEDNNEELIEYDPYRICSIPFIKSVFRQLVCRYELFHEMEIKKLQTQLNLIFSKIYYLFIDALQTMVIKKKYLKPGTCEKSDFEQGLKYCDTYLTPRQFEYIQYLNYVEFKEIQFIQYQQIITNLRTRIE